MWLPKKKNPRFSERGLDPHTGSTGASLDAADRERKDRGGPRRGLRDVSWPQERSQEPFSEITAVVVEGHAAHPSAADTVSRGTSGQSTAIHNASLLCVVNEARCTFSIEVCARAVNGSR